MAASAKPENHIDVGMIDEYLDRFEELEDKAIGIMTEAMAACKGPRGEQRTLRKEMKEAGIRMQTFNALWAGRMVERKLDKKINDLEGDDLDQLREFVAQMSGTPMGDMFNERLKAG